MNYITYAGIIGVILFFSAVFFLLRPDWENNGQGRTEKGRVPLAVLGDSDSHSYRDKHLGTQRGGDYHEVTFQWTEILARLRPAEIELGQFGYWGTRGIIYKFRQALGLDARTPRKQDFEYNFARTGSVCSELSPGSYEQQSVQLVKLMDKAPGYWQKGLVVIRIGINDFGQWSMLRTYESGEITGTIRQPIINCINHIQNAVTLIRQQHPAVKIVLVGIVDNSNWPLDEETDDQGHRNINEVLDIFDSGLADIAALDPNMLFVEDRDWFTRVLGKWGPAHFLGSREYSLGGGVSIVNSRGDHPRNIMLADKHASTVANALWVNNLITEINHYFGMGFTPLSNSEIAGLVDPEGMLNIAPD